MEHEGPAVKCNVSVTCPMYGGRSDVTIILPDQEDPTIVDQGSSSWNKARCIDAMKNKNICDLGTIHIKPTLICLDAAGMPTGSGPNVTGTSGGTIVTVGVGAGTGDYYFNGAEEGTGGFGGGSGDFAGGSGI